MKPLQKILLIIFFTGVLLWIAANISDKGFKKYYGPYFEKMNYVFHDSSYNDVIYLGNSRANFGINPFFVDSVCHTRSYNLGFGGIDIGISVEFLKGYLQHHPAPKLLVYNYDYRIFAKRSYLELAPVYLYYTQQNPVREILSRYDYHYRLVQFLPPLKYSFFNDYYRTCIIKGLRGNTMNTLNVHIEKRLYDYRGFLNYQTGMINPDEKTDTSMPQLDRQCVLWMNELVNICNKKNIKIAFIYPPEYYRDTIISPELKERKFTIDSMIHSIVLKNNFYYTRFDTAQFEAADFIDLIHVNIRGSRKYSVMLGEYLKGVIESLGH